MATNERHQIGIDVNAQDNITLPLKAIESGIIRFVGAVSASLVAVKAITFEITSAGDLQKELLNVQKTTEFADSTIQQFGVSLRDLSKDVDVTATDLAKIAAVGGQLGLGSQGSEALEQFTDSASRMSSVLDVAVENAANGIAKITNIFKIGLKDAENIASAFNELSNNSTASGEDLLDVVQRIGDAGGTIDLTQALGLAATGVDFGLTLETIGTSFTKVFLDMQSKASQFAQLMNMSTADWAATVEQDGIGALKMYLAKLRELRSDERARTAEQLTGGGRVFSLINKLVQDTNNTLLDKNIMFAEEGWRTGTSAIREQQTVLQGFNAQLQITSNHFSALATAAGEEALPGVTALLGRMQEWLASPEVEDGVLRLSAALGSMARSVVDLFRFVGDLNINWDNMVKIGGAWVALNIVRHMTAWLGSLGAVRASIAMIDGSGGVPFLSRLQSIAQQAKVAATNVAGLAANAMAATAGTTAGRLPSGVTAAGSVNTQAAANAARSYAAALKQQAAAMLGLESLYANSLALDRAKAESAVALAEQQKAADAVTVASREAANAKLIVQDNARLAKEAGASQRRILLNDMERRRLEIDTQRSLALRSAATTAEILLVEEHFAKQLAASDLYYQRKLSKLDQNLKKELVAVVRAGEQEIAATRAILAAKERMHQESAARVAAAQEVQNAAAQQRTLTAGAALTAIVGKIMTGLTRLLSAALWVGLIATILDMLGLIRPLTDAFFKLADAIGLTSEAERKLAQERRLARREEEEKAKRVRALRDEYLKLATAQGGLTPAAFDARVGQAGNRRDETAQTIVDFSTRFAAASAYTESASPVQASFAKENAALAKSFDEVNKKIAETEQKLQAFQNLAAKEKSKGRGADNILIAGWLSQAKELDLVLAELRARHTDLSRQMQRTGSDAAQGVAQHFARVNAEVEAFIPRLKRSYTEGMAEIADAAVLPGLRVKEELARVREEEEKLRDAINVAENDKPVFGAREVQMPDGTNAGLEEARDRLARLKNEATAYETALKLAADAVNAFVAANSKDGQGKTILDLFTSSRAEVVERVVEALNRLRGTGQLTGEVPLAATKGKEDAKGTSNISSGDLALARFRLEKEKLDQEVRVLRETLSQEEEADRDRYQRGLKGLERYYDSREVLIRARLEGELEIRRREREEAMIAYNNAGQNDPNDKEAQQLSALTSVARIDGDIRILQNRLKNVGVENDRERIAAVEERNRELVSLEIEHADAVGDIRRASALQLERQYEEVMRRLQSERLNNEIDLQIAIDRNDEAEIKRILGDEERINRTLALIIDMKGFGTVEAEIDEFIQRTRSKLDLGLAAPGDIGNLVAQQLENIVPRLDDELRNLRQQLFETNDEAKKIELAERLERATVRANGLRRSLTDLYEQAIVVFNEEIDIKVRLGVVGQTEAGEQIVAFARQQAENLRRTQIAPLQQQARLGPLAEADQRMLDSLILKYESLRNTVSDLATDINGSVRGAFVDFFASVADGTTRMADGIDQLGQRFRSLLAETLANDLVDKFIGPMLSGAGSLGDMVSQTLNPGRQKGDTKQNALWVRSADGPVAQAFPVVPSDQFGMPQQSQELLPRIGTLFKEGFTGLERMLGGDGSMVTGLFSTVGEYLKPFTDAFGGLLGAGGDKGGQKAQGVMGLVSGLFGGEGEGGKALGPLGSSPANPLYVAMVSSLGGAPVPGAAATALPGGTPQDVVTDAVATVDITGEGGEKGAMAQVTGFLGEVKDGFLGVVNDVSEGFGGVIDFLGDGFSGLLEGIGGVFKSLFSGTGGGGGGGFMSMIGSFFHTGGIVGGHSTRRTVNPLAFIGAPRYHTGGIAGLAPNEVAAVLEKGEEVLTANDPRHSSNGGRSNRGPSPMSVSLDVTPAALHMTMRDWLESEINSVLAKR